MEVACSIFSRAITCRWGLIAARGWARLLLNRLQDLVPRMTTGTANRTPNGLDADYRDGNEHYMARLHGNNGREDDIAFDFDAASA